MTFNELYDPITDVKPCPICGKHDKLRVMSKKFFEECEHKYETTLIDIECRRCDLVMKDYTLDEHDYDKRRAELANKWNMRGGWEA